MDVSLGFDLVVVWEAVHFVDEHLEVDLWIDPVGPRHSEVKPAQGLHVVVLKEDHMYAARTSSLTQRKGSTNIQV